MKDKIYLFFKYTGEFSLYALLFFLPISNSLIEVFFGVAVFSFIIRKVLKPDFNTLKFRPNLFILVFFIFIGISVINSGQFFYKSLWAWLAKWGQYIGICFITQDTITEKRVLKRAIMIFLFSAGLVVLSGLSQRFLGFEFLRERSLMNIGHSFYASTSVFKHYNSLGAYIIVVIPLIVGSLVAEIENKGRFVVLLGVFLFCSIFISVFTFSRGSWLGLGFSILFLVSLVKSLKARLIILATAILFITFLILPIVISYFVQPNAFVSAQPNVYFSPSSRLLSTFQPNGDSDRLRYWQVALRMIWESPLFGKGVGTFMDYFSRYVTLNPSYAHNCYLQIWAETGVFSLLCFLIYIASLFWLGIKRFLAENDYLLFGLLGGIAAYLAHAFFETSLYSLPLAFLFWIWAGLISASVRMGNNNGGAK